MKNNSVIMFHHFHSKNNNYKMNGSFSESQLVKILKKKEKKQIFTFDDGLKSQYKIARKHLEKYKLKGIFFINSFQFEKLKSIDNETIKFIIKKKFKTDRDFYKIFFKHPLIKKVNFNYLNIKKEKNKYSFYSNEDIKFRYVRDKHQKNYQVIISNILKNYKIDFNSILKKIYLSKNEIFKLSKKHEIGLHSHSHINNCDELNFKKQYNDFKKNKKILEKIIKKKITKASFPKGKYNLNTLKALNKLKIKNVYLNKEKKIENKNYKDLQIIGRINCNQL